MATVVGACVAAWLIPQQQGPGAIAADDPTAAVAFTLR
jgi:hypothetical protein